MKRDKTERVPVPEDAAERFMGIIHSMVGAFGIDKITDVMHYIELLDQSVDRYLFDVKHQVSPQKKENEKRRRFIAVFEKRHLHHTDLDYSRPITAIDAKMIIQATEKIEEKGFTTDEFLQWVFEVFLVEEPKFNPPNIHFVCTNFVVEKFLYDNRDRIKQKQEEDIREKDALDVVNRARAVMRAYREASRGEDAEKIVILLKKYAKEGIISLEDVRMEVQRAEEELGQNQIEQEEQTQGGENGEQHSGEASGESGCPNDDGQGSGDAG
jgi:hypothetical protein